MPTLFPYTTLFRSRARPQFPAQVEAALGLVAQADVDDHQVRQLQREGGACLGAAGIGLHGVTVPTQCLGIVVADGRFVLDDGNGAWHGGQTSQRPRPGQRIARELPHFVAVLPAAGPGPGRCRRCHGPTHREAAMDSHRITRKPRMFRRPARVLLQAWLAGLMLLLAPLAGASGGLEDDYGLQVREEDRWVASLAMDTTVHMQVHGLLAEVTVRQTYR